MPPGHRGIGDGETAIVGPADEQRLGADLDFVPLQLRDHRGRDPDLEGHGGVSGSG